MSDTGTTTTLSAAFEALTQALQRHALDNPKDWQRAGGYIQASAQMRENFEAGFSVSGKAAGPGAKRGRKPKAVGADVVGDDVSEALESAEVEAQDGEPGETQFESDPPAARASRGRGRVNA